MSDEKKPEGKPTVPFQAVPEWAVELTRRVVSGQSAVIGRLDNQDTVLERVVNEGVRTNTRLDRIELRVDEVEGRIGRTSTGVRGLSQTDVAHEAQLQHEKTAREALATKVEAIEVVVTEGARTNAVQLAILTRLDKVTSNPLVKTLGAMLLTALITWLATHGVKVSP